jgi:hypothetical protein
MWIAIVFGSLIGFLWGAFFPMRRIRRQVMSAFRQQPVATYRDPIEPTRTPNELVAAARAAGLTVRERSHGFDLCDRERHRLEVRYRTKGGVRLADIDLVDDGSNDLVPCLAVAWVPLYGSLTVTDLFGTYSVDSTSSVEALCEAQRERLKAFGRQVAEDLGHMATTWSAVEARR